MVRVTRPAHLQLSGQGRHRRRLHLLDPGERAQGHRTVLLDGGERGELRDRQSGIGTLAQPTVEARDGEPETGRKVFVG